mmetsp:Transcript_45125/g.71694  ORF Transcript_45125/g.71694 Transcript_45125/m.71694 type:complete len:139 (+) Transcript_45125:128-544(+)
MKLLIFLLCCVLLCKLAAGHEAQTAKKVKRNLVQFGHMIKCATGRSPLDYINYGCYCGWGGGGYPVDDTDRCCKEHDECYGQVGKLCWPKVVLYFRYQCTGCSGLNNSCQSHVCECDRKAALCFKRSHYNKANKGRCN